MRPQIVREEQRVEIEVKDANKANIYCYCITEASDPVIGSLAGIDSDYKPYSISHKDISMIVSKVSQDEFSEDRLKDAIEDIMWVGKYAVRHEAIVEAVMKCCSPLLPMRFCTIYRDEPRIKTILEENYLRFTEALNYLRDKEEYGVKIYVEKGVFKKRMESASNDISKDADSGSISGRNYLLKRKIEKETQNILMKELSSRKNDIHSVISEWTTKFAANRIIDAGDKTKGETLISSISYLVEDTYLERFHRAIRQLNNSYAHEGLRLVTSGPWPCYSFSPEIEQSTL